MKVKTVNIFFSGVIFGASHKILKGMDGILKLELVKDP